MRKSALAGLVILCSLALGVLSFGRRAEGPPRLVLLVVVDQLSYDYLTRFDDLYQGGFRALLDKGAVYTEARFQHALTLTGPGHAAVATGLHPSQSGVVANNWYDATRGEAVNCVFDPQEKPVGGAGRQASPRAMLADSLGDRLKKKYSASQNVTLAIKDRAAILLAGRKADGAYWFSERCGCFISSSFFMKELPAWLAAFNRSGAAERYRGKSWTRLLDNPQIYEARAREDDFAGENGGKQTTFPHPMPDESSEYFYSLAQTPFGEEVLLEAVMEAIKGHKLGADQVPDLLAVGFSASDYVGHRYGPFSQEAMDQHLRLDALLGRLFQAVDEQVGLDKTVIALTSDHGVIPIVEQLQRQGIAAKRVPKRALEEAVNRAVAERFPKVSKVVVFEDAPHFSLDLAQLERLGIDRAAVEETARRALLETGFVEQVYTHGDMRGEPRRDDPFWRLYRNSFFERRSPHLMVRLKEYYYVDGSQGPTGHGSPYDYDRHVALILMGPGVKPGRYEQPSAPEDLAPTLGHMLGVKMPLEPDGRLLREMLE